MNTPSTDDGSPIAVPPGNPCVVVIFGASGDLTQRKLVPALLNLEAHGHLSPSFAVLGVARRPMSDEAFRDEVRPARCQSDEEAEAAWDALAPRIFYQAGDVQKKDALDALVARLAALDASLGTRGNRLFYLALAPKLIAPIVEALGRGGLLDESSGSFRRVIVEKPFGHDLPSAIALNATLREVIPESQIFRIDHYLGKETVQNLLVFRFGNGIFEPIWNRNYIDHVQITVAEELGVESRGDYYDTAGATRDMVPNHVAQLLSLVGMEPPMSFSADAVRDEQVKVLRSFLPICTDDALECSVRGQYGAGTIGGASVPAYRDEEKIARGSETETFLAARFRIDNWRWADVPFYVRTGKRLPTRCTQIVIQLKRAPFTLFRETLVDHLATNRLVVRIQPSEGISLRFGAKIPGPVVQVSPVTMDFRYTDYFRARRSTGYETLLYDAMVGDATLFQRADMVEAGWRLVEPILEAWKVHRPAEFPNYAAGTWGPSAANELIRRDGRAWEDPEP